MYKGVVSGFVATTGDIRQISRDLINTDANGSYREQLLTDSGLELPGLGNPVHLNEQINKTLAKLPEDVLSSLDGLSVDEVAIDGHLAVRTKIPETELSLITILSRAAAYGQVSSRFFLYSASAFPLILLIAAILFDRVRRVGIALTQSEQRFRTIFDNVRDVIFVLDITSLTIVEANPRVLSLYGYEQGEVVGLTMADISRNEESDSLRIWAENVAAAISGKPQLYVWRTRRKNGEAFWVEISMLRAVIGQHDRLLVVAHDITQLKTQELELIQTLEDQRKLNRLLEEAQSQLIQSEKMASIGQLAAGIAHEINNPIAFVNSNIGTLSDYVANLLKMLTAYQQEEGSLSPERSSELAKLREVLDITYLSGDVHVLLKESLEGLQRVRKIVADLKDFAHVGETKFQFANLENGLDSTLNVVWNELKYKADVIKEYAGIPEIECIPSQLNQVFMNLLVNAAQSIAQHGRITVRTAFNEKNLWIEIEDTGSGISPEHLSRIFEPFFTTKPVGKGTGLGLSLAYGIVNKHGGQITVSSEKGGGSLFRVILPLQRTAPLPS
jgi:PAS domain S-box-containing protein